MFNKLSCVDNDFSKVTRRDGLNPLSKIVLLLIIGIKLEMYVVRLSYMTDLFF